jgi:hypothetical protein
MFNFKTLVQQALLAIALAIGSGAAVAGPTYQVTVDTAAFAGETGLMDFFFFSNGGAPSAIATLSNFSGAFGAELERGGSVAGDIPGGVSFTNTDGFNYLTQVVSLGGKFMFNISFAGDYETIGGADGASFTLGLYDADFVGSLGVPVEFQLVPAFMGVAADVIVLADASLANVNVVPEPSELLLMLSALAMMGLVVRRRSRKAA